MARHTDPDTVGMELEESVVTVAAVKDCRGKVRRSEAGTTCGLSGSTLGMTEEERGETQCRLNRIPVKNKKASVVIFPQNIIENDKRDFPDHE